MLRVGCPWLPAYNVWPVNDVINNQMVLGSKPFPSPTLESWVLVENNEVKLHYVF